MCIFDGFYLFFQIDDDWIQQNELLDEVNDLLQSSTVFAGMAMKSKATIAEVKPPALTPAPTLAAKVPPVEVRPKPKINVTSHVVIKGVKCEIVSKPKKIRNFRGFGKWA